MLHFLYCCPREGGHLLREGDGDPPLLRSHFSKFSFTFDEVLTCVETSDGKDASVRENKLGLKLIKVWCRMERKKKTRRDEYERNDEKNDGKVLMKNRLMLLGNKNNPNQSPYPSSKISTAMLKLTSIQWYHVDQVTLVSVSCDIQTQPFIH